MDQLQIGKIAVRGHKVHPDRGTYTHALYWQDVQGLPAEHEITDKGQPVYSRLLGRNVQVGDLLPERLALAVNSSGEILHQSDFRDRYVQYLIGFKTDRKAELEPVPNVKTYLLTQIDPAKPPNAGKAFYVELGFDATRHVEPNDTGKWHPDGILMDEWKKRNPREYMQLTGESASANETKAKMLTEMHASGEISAEVFAKKMASLFGTTAVASEPVTKPAASVESSNADAAPGRDAMPCGKTVKAGFKKQHQRFCKDPACAADGMAEAQ